MLRLAALIYGAIAYVLFLAVVTYAIGFVGDYHFRIADGVYFVPNALDFGRPPVPTLRALMIDIPLLLLFALQHSGMARQPFKTRLTQFISPVIERSTYVVATNIALGLLFWQ